VGEDNFFLFGLTAQEVHEKQAAGYRPRDILNDNEDLHEVIELLRSGFFSRGDRKIFEKLVSGLCERDEFMVLADFASYMVCQDRASAAFRDVKQWTRMSILNTARMGKFSSDRAIREYCEDIWKIRSVRVSMDPESRGSR
jgi:starch phosphorylase